MRRPVPCAGSTSGKRPSSGRWRESGWCVCTIGFAATEVREGALNRTLHRSAPDGTPAVIALDQEGGLVQRVRAPATMWPPMMSHDQLSSPDDVEVAFEVGRALGGELRALGFDVDFAPVLDVHT